MPTLLEEAELLRGELIGFRHELHRVPEVGLHLPRTQALVLERLGGLDGLEITPGTRQSSVTVVLRGGRDNPLGGGRQVVLLRGDMDALPVTEATGLDFSSTLDGTMHACGHDVHMAGLYGALRLLHARRDELAVDVVFMFQPGEETYDGARFMVQDGVLEAAGRRVDAAFGLHVFSAEYENGVFYSRPGPLMAGCDELFVTVRGEGGHGSTPHLTRDPVPVACEMVLAMQTLVTRHFNVFDPVVATIGKLVSGTAGNVIPDTATFDVTLRTFSPGHKERLCSELQRLFRGIAEGHGLTVEVEVAPDYPVTVNDPAEYAYAAGVLTDVFGDGAFREMEFPVPGSEDFSHVLREVPGAFIMLGATTADSPAEGASNHSPRAAFDDAVVPKAAAALAELAFRRAHHC
ncbi:MULTISPECIES: M20 family metallopeptidase [unclassified Arthrobacter]|uniref:M20 metallopeptidase family protein n=1 Tax=unclassified Arthrobacter TaxID=235627 RepID=UPI00159D4F01|nr:MULTISPECIES: M20 family metallopeptidase [unclassified Arthrobacter]MCQ9165939.1 M20 family metallopeptidase [Arthrobacter sp. STN4]NVN00743.1 amidohydrolase [Arthrobacter sp. SDTb3-6]